MLLADYASDSGSDSEGAPGPSVPKKSAPAPKAPPAAASTSGTSSSQPAKAKKRTGPVRITLDLPKAADDDDRSSKRANGADGDDDEETAPEAKKPKLGEGGLKGGKGSSSLLGILPPPKRKLPASGSGGKIGLPTISKSTLPKPTPGAFQGADDDLEPPAPSGGLLLPSSIARGKAKAESAEKAAASIDLFGLSSAPSSSSTSIPSSSKPTARPTEISSAPDAPDFVPPPPTSTDPYPGYYQLPSGTWAAYEPSYYASFFSSDADDVGGMARPKNGDDGRVGRHWDAFEGREGDVLEISATSGLAEARAEEERKKSIIKPRTLGDSFEYEAIGQVKGLASERHQLTSLLSSAYTQRDALEEKLAANKKSMRAARTKYGF